MDCSTPGVQKTVLALMQLTGFVQTRRSSSDRRSKTYRPTARMGDFVRQWLGSTVRALDVIEPDTELKDDAPKAGAISAEQSQPPPR